MWMTPIVPGWGAGVDVMGGECYQECRFSPIDRTYITKLAAAKNECVGLSHEDARFHAKLLRGHPDSFVVGRAVAGRHRASSSSPQVFVQVCSKPRPSFYQRRGSGRNEATRDSTSLYRSPAPSAPTLPH